MITLPQALSATGAVSYFKDDYEHARSRYYEQEEKITGRWGGKLAEKFGLKGAVALKQFERLCNGQDPNTGAQLIRLVKAHTRTRDTGKKFQTRGHRAGFDITFNAPKSISLAAIVGGDERIQAAQAVAVKTALDFIEQKALARLGGNAPAERTGKLIYAIFEHDAARPDHKED